MSVCTTHLEKKYDHGNPPHSSYVKVNMIYQTLFYISWPKIKCLLKEKNASEIPAGFIVFWLECFILEVNHLPKQITVVIHMSSAKTLENSEKTKKPFTLDSDHLPSYPYIFPLFLK